MSRRTGLNSEDREGGWGVVVGGDQTEMFPDEVPTRNTMNHMQLAGHLKSIPFILPLIH